MSKRIDCSNTVNFFKEKERLTNNCRISCLECPLNLKYNGMDVGCSTLIRLHPEKAVEILQKWSDENPVKTRLDDFKEKYPDYQRDEDNYPTICVRRLGYKQEICKNDRPPLSPFEFNPEYCNECWDMPKY